MPDFILINNLDTSLADELSSALASAQALDVAAAYFSINGYEHIINGVESLLDRGGAARFLLGGRITPFFYQIEDVKNIADEFEERLGGRRGKMIAHSEYYKLISIRAQAEGSPFLRIVPFIKTTYLREFCSSSDAIYNALVGQDREENGLWQLEQDWNGKRDLECNVGGNDADAARMGLKGKILKALRDGFVQFGKADAEVLERIQAIQPELFEQIEEVDEETFRIKLNDEQERGLRDELRRVNGFARRINECAPFAKTGGDDEMRVLSIE